MVEHGSGLLKQVLVSAKQNPLLISTEKQDTLWPVPRKQEDGWITQVEADNKCSPKWMVHPNGDFLVGIQNLDANTHAIGVYKGSNLELVHSIPVVEGVRIGRLLPLQNQEYFATSSDKRNSTSILLWRLDDLGPETFSNAPLTPLTHLDSLPSQVEAIIGTFGTRLVFSISDYWIASVELASLNTPISTDQVLDITPPPTATESVVKHFFLPNDWMGSNATSPGRKLIFELGRAGEILFVRRSELAVVKRGLEVTERGVGFNPRGGGSGVASRGGSRPSNIPS